jgi:hypothetical protein
MQCDIIYLDVLRSPCHHILVEKKRIIFISCGIFKEELEYLIREKGLDWNITFLDAALHVNFDKLKEHLVRTLEENRKEGAELKVLYGHCHPDIMEILEKYGAKKMEAGNCLEAIVGAEEIKRLDSEAKSFFLTAGWINNWKKMFDLGKSDFDFDFKTMFANYKRIIVFDSHIVPINEDNVIEFSEFTELPVERKSISLDYFQNLIKEM